MHVWYAHGVIVSRRLVRAVHDRHCFHPLLVDVPSAKPFVRGFVCTPRAIFLESFAPRLLEPFGEVAQEQFERDPMLFVDGGKVLVEELFHVICDSIVDDLF